jgi:uncharacterized membrane protein
MSRAVGSQAACVSGAALIVVAAWLAWPPLSLFIAGSFLVAFGVHLHRSGK